MTCPPSDDKLPESFFSTLYPEFDTPVEAPEALSLSAHGDRLARLMEHWPGAVFCLDAQLRCLLANREARGWCQPLNPDVWTDGQPHPLPELLTPALLEALLPYLSAALRGMELAFDDQFEHPTLGWRNLSIRTQPDQAGDQVVGVFLHLQDSTDIHRATQLAQHHQAQQHPTIGTDGGQQRATRLHLMAEHLREAAIFFLDANGCICDWPASAAQLLGHSASAVLGQPVQCFDATDPPQDAPDTPTALERATFLGHYDSVGWRIHHTGHRFWSQLGLTALHDPDSGELLGYACLLRDMTDIKRLEDLLRQWNQELEARVQERTQQLQDINQDLEAFSYSVSHDLRTPLRHIASFVEMLQEHLGNNADPTTRQYLGTLSDSAAYMGQMIEGLLAFSRLGRAPLTHRPVAMGALVQSSINRVLHDPTLQRPPEQLHWSIPDDLPTLPGDNMLLSQVWDNLLANALKYSRKRAVADIRIAWHTEADGTTVFAVHDNGVGFDPKRAERLFGVFQRLHRASEFEGTGIGLALCRRIMERHGGRIWADSTPGVGSSFYFSLPSQSPSGGVATTPHPAAIQPAA